MTSWWWDHITTRTITNNCTKHFIMVRIFYQIYNSFVSPKLIFWVGQDTNVKKVKEVKNLYNVKNVMNLNWYVVPSRKGHNEVHTRDLCSSHEDRSALLAKDQTLLQTLHYGLPDATDIVGEPRWGTYIWWDNTWVQVHNFLEIMHILNFLHHLHYLPCSIILYHSLCFF